MDKNWYEQLKTNSSGFVEINKIDVSDHIAYLLNFEGPFLRFWIEKSPRVLFKMENKYTNIFNELFCSYLGKRIGQKSIDVKPAMFYDNFTNTLYKGIVTPDYIEDREKANSISFNKYGFDTFHTSVEKIVEIVKVYSDVYTKRDKKIFIDTNLKNDLYKLALFDFVTLQDDRSAVNIEFTLIKINPNYSKMSLSPTFDNSSSFIVSKNVNFDDLKCEADEINFIAILQNLITYNISLLHPQSLVTKNGDANNKYGDNLFTFAKIISTNAEMLQYYKQLTLVSTQDVIADITKNNPGYSISFANNYCTEYIYNKQIVNIWEKLEPMLSSNQRTFMTQNNTGLISKLDYIDTMDNKFLAKYK